MTTTRTVVITGANRGLGLALATAYRLRGDHVIAGCRNPAQATALAETGSDVIALDTGDEASIQQFAATVGSSPVDILFNNAGSDARAFGAVDAKRGALDLSAEQFNAVLAVNTIGPMLIVQALAPNLRAAASAAGAAKIINVSSQVGSFEIAQKIGRDVSYATSKAALNMVSLKQSQVLSGDGVIVVAMHPGYLRTDMGGAAADLDPSEAAATIAATVDALDMTNTGTFIRWNGTAHPY